jgi:hypothetical protein
MEISGRLFQWSRKVLPVGQTDWSGTVPIEYLGGVASWAKVEGMAVKRRRAVVRAVVRSFGCMAGGLLSFTRVLKVYGWLVIWFSLDTAWPEQRTVPPRSDNDTPDPTSVVDRKPYIGRSSVWRPFF